MIEYIVSDAIECVKDVEDVALVHLDDAWDRPDRNGHFGVFYPTHDFSVTCELLDLCMESLIDGGWLIATVDDWLLPRLLEYIKKEYGDVTEDYQGGGYRKIGFVTYVKGKSVNKNTAGMYLRNGGYPVIFMHKGETNRRSSVTKCQIARKPKKDYGWGSVKPIEPYMNWIEGLTLEDELILEPCAGTGPATIAAESLGRRAVAIDCQSGAKEAYQRRREKEVRPNTNSLI